MGLFSGIKSRLFPPELSRVAKTGDASTIAECISRTSIVVIAADLGDSISFDTDQQSAIALVEAATQKKTFDGSVHKYEIDGSTFLPIFTDVPTAEAFCGAYCGLLNHIHAFRLFTAPGAYLRDWIAEQDFIVVNPQSHNEVEIDRSNSLMIREQLPNPDQINEIQFTSLVIPMIGISQTVEFAPDT